MSSDIGVARSNSLLCPVTYGLHPCESPPTNDDDLGWPRAQKLVVRHAGPRKEGILQKRQRHFDPDFISKLTPRGGLQAAEFEDRQFGYLSVDGSKVCYTDALLGVVLLSTEFASGREASLQMDFYWSTFREVKARRSAFQAVKINGDISFCFEDTQFVRV